MKDTTVKLEEIQSRCQATIDYFTSLNKHIVKAEEQELIFFAKKYLHLWKADTAREIIIRKFISYNISIIQQIQSLTEQIEKILNKIFSDDLDESSEKNIQLEIDLLLINIHSLRHIAIDKKLIRPKTSQADLDTVDLYEDIYEVLESCCSKEADEFCKKFLLIRRKTEGSSVGYYFEYNIPASNSYNQKINHKYKLLSDRIQKIMDDQDWEILTSTYPYFSSLSSEILANQIQTSTSLEKFHQYLGNIKENTNQTLQEIFGMHMEMVQNMEKVDELTKEVEKFEKRFSQLKERIKQSERDYDQRKQDEIEQQILAENITKEAQRKSKIEDHILSKETIRQQKIVKEQRKEEKEKYQSAIHEALQERAKSLLALHQQDLANTSCFFISSDNHLTKEQRELFIEILTENCNMKYRLEKIKSFMESLGIRKIDKSKTTGSHIKVTRSSTGQTSNVWFIHSNDKENKMPQAAIDILINALWELGYIEGDREKMRGNKKNMVILEKFASSVLEPQIIHSPKRKKPTQPKTQ